MYYFFFFSNVHLWIHLFFFFFSFCSTAQLHLWKSRTANQRPPAGVNVQHRGQNPLQLQSWICTGGSHHPLLSGHVSWYSCLGFPSSLLQRYVGRAADICLGWRACWVLIKLHSRNYQSRWKLDSNRSASGFIFNIKHTTSHLINLKVVGVSHMYTLFPQNVTHSLSTFVSLQCFLQL